eukprot:3004825-Rhodomonas_salina.1
MGAALLFMEAVLLLTEAALPFTGAVLPFTEAVLPFTEAVFLSTEAVFLSTEAVFLSTEAVFLLTEAVFLFTEAGVPFTEAVLPYTTAALTTRRRVMMRMVAGAGGREAEVEREARGAQLGLHLPRVGRRRHEGSLPVRPRRPPRLLLAWKALTSRTCRFKDKQMYLRVRRLLTRGIVHPCKLSTPAYARRRPFPVLTTYSVLCEA